MQKKQPPPKFTIKLRTANGAKMEIESDPLATGEAAERIDLICFAINMLSMWGPTCPRDAPPYVKEYDKALNIFMEESKKYYEECKKKGCV